MGIYEDHVLPYIIHLAMNNQRAAEQREKFVPLAEGVVLEVGIGSGLNLPFYAGGVTRLYGLDPSPRLKRMAEKRVRAAPFPVEFIGLSGEDVPLDDGSIDTVLMTWTLCSIPDAAAVLGEMKRVLKPDGRLVFVEHGRAPESSVVAWQDRLTPTWKRFSGGCHLNRRIDELIRGAGFDIARLETCYIKGPRPLTFLYKGLARPA